MSVFKDFDELLVPSGDFRDGGFTRGLFGKKANERFPEDRSTHGEADESIDASCRRQPLAHFLIVFTTSKNDASNFVPPAAMCCGHDLFAVFTTIESLDLPDIWLDARVLQLLDRLNHQLGTKLQIIGFLVAFHPFELCLLRGDEQFKHEPALALGM